MIYGTLINEFADECYIIEADDEIKNLFANWSTSNEKHKRIEFKNDNVSEEDYDKLIEAYKVLRTTEKYEEYKKAFEVICKFCHIRPEGTILTKCSIRSGKEKNKNSIFVQYAYNTKKIKLPEGIKLYHMSKVAGIKELIPAFRGKSAKGFMYYKPRIYFTLHKKMSKFLADYRINEKMHKYECVENIKDVFVDPLIWSKGQGAVYVETNKPIKVEEMGLKKQ